MMSEQKRKLSDMKEGEEFKPLEFKMTPEVIGFNCIALDDRHPWYTQDSPFGGRIVPSLDAQFCAIRIAVNHRDGALTGALFEKPGLIHYVYDAEYFEPARIGETVKITGKCAKRYEKRGRDYMDFEYEIHGQDGRLVCKYKNSFLLEYRKEGR